MVKVYSITQCPWCDKVKKYLKSRGVAYEEHNIKLSDADRDECYKISGDLIVPVTTVNGKDFVVSFDKAKLDALLGL
ncbi:glutaredoxin domain-containing protein [Mitsuokella multacida]|uniref:glutaredoxin domain-containing protein n=1 Tax=Mitsuokella multacida TaxID=52226 RepID=UPI00242D38D8|nr:glutaredoxin domain-containing protein [Mitsuokella multacida]